jgi:hypothetical protein
MNENEQDQLIARLLQDVQAIRCVLIRFLGIEAATSDDAQAYITRISNHIDAQIDPFQGSPFATEQVEKVRTSVDTTILAAASLVSTGPDTPPQKRQ